MASNILKLQNFRTNDLVNDGGKQFELGKSWCNDFFEFDEAKSEVVVNLQFKALQESHMGFNDKYIELKLADVSTRGDRKAYVNGENGMSQIKDFFINYLRLSPENNLQDYFAIYKATEFDYYLYFVPSLLYNNFLQYFKSVIPSVSISHWQSIPIEHGTALQQIYYGAPGTGKSFEINRLTRSQEVIRTTFHPDSDYSTFVGAYKPTSIEVPVRDVTGKVIVENGQQVTENRIVYEFVEQAFLQAYTKAWKAYAEKGADEKAKEQYLVIEEINRGNCAQIFGDLFQLLDRNEVGFSDYPISADKDMKKQLAKAFKGMVISDAERINGFYEKDVVSKVLSGDILLLPDNLYIWATMNTSDQSLFPIDSAFKRRWDWKYIPISEGKKENGDSMGYKIEVKGKRYDWWDFLEKINKEIDDQTKSEDKKLGYFFCKANDGIINAETFVSKVVFYLWNDVFKDQDVGTIFSDGDEELTFAKFYETDRMGKAIVREDKVEVLLKNLGVSESEEGDDVISDDTESDTRRILHVDFSDETIAIIRFPEYLQVLRKIGLEKAEAVASEKQVNVLGCALVTKEPEETIENSQYSYVEADGYYVVKGIKGKVMQNFLPLISDRYNLNLKIEYR